MNSNMRCILFFLLVLSFQMCFSQNTIDSLEVDDKYREDQFYISATYNLLESKPNGVSQRGFSTGIHFGFIRDMPINKKRNFAIGLGIGLSSNSYNQNVLITETNGVVNYEVIDENEITFTKNKFTTYVLEFPLEFRWRTSTAKDYKFWRIYTGIKVGYLFYNSSKFEGSLGNINNSGINTFNDFQYGLTLSAGYSTFNFYLYYGLNTIFNDEAIINNQPFNVNDVKLGLIIYIL